MSRYLIVDDNEAFADNLAEILRDRGHEPVVAGSGARALELARAVRFDAFVSDMRMPAMRGPALVRALKALDPGLPAIVITAYTADAELDEARRQGVLAVLPKPVPMAELVALLDRARRDAVVAVVEDDAALADNLREVLMGAGFATVLARSVAEAEALAEARPFAAVADLRVPGGPDGEALRRLCARCPDVPVVVTSGFSELASPVAAAARFDKPFDPARVVATLAALHAAATR